MVVQRNRDQGTSEMNSGEGTVENGTAGVSGYEQFRDQRIKENNERLQKLGILDLALKLKPKAATPKRSQSQRDSSVQTKIHKSPRRSSRLKTVAPVSYVEIRKPKEKESINIYIKKGSKREVYTEEHEKQLGDCNTSWPLGIKLLASIHIAANVTRSKGSYVEIACSRDMERICLKPTKILIGFALFVGTSATAIFAVKQKGGNPLVSKLGYKSLAHYLIQTHRSQIKSETSGAEVADEGSEPSSHDEFLESTTHQPEDLRHDEGFFTTEEKMGEMHFLGIKHVDVNDVGKLDDVAAGDANDGEAKSRN
ncbi:hypothetical protein Prudu_022011 [Prunus dulcis]|uniref:Uncharacterized protein n=1 Tax=Prunus dulcis TaxID=3755 RepID=A0A4Y1RYK5_PRUDU|nr:hypothetical protein Prudu_022011 [Prunus dulcis]